MADKDIEADVDSAVSVFVQTMEALNITLTDEEIDAKRRELMATATGELVITGDIPNVETWEQVMQLGAGDILIVDDFVKLDDKSKLINVPFFVRNWSNVDGEMGEFSVLYCITERPIRTDTGETSKIIVTDGSTGIHRQLREITKRTKKTSGLVVRNGLRVSQYTADTDEGPKLAETFYLT